MSRSKRIEPLAEIADRKAREAARQLATSLDDVAHKRAAVEQLRGYLAEYRDRSHRDGRNVESGRWRNEQLFLARLGEAIAIREGELEQAAERLQHETETWQAAHYESRALEQLVSKHLERELKERERREQDDSDELVSLRAVRPEKPLA
jgi:flagellar FliJ protein